LWRRDVTASGDVSVHGGFGRNATREGAGKPNRRSSARCKRRCSRAPVERCPMSVAAALLAELTDADLLLLAERLRPRLEPHEGGSGWLRGAGRLAEYIDAPSSR